MFCSENESESESKFLSDLKSSPSPSPSEMCESESESKTKTRQKSLVLQYVMKSKYNKKHYENKCSKNTTPSDFSTDLVPYT